LLITKEELLPFNEYARLRPKFVQEVISEKKRRRVTLSDKMSGVFENRLTVWFQIQEMIHAEQIQQESYIDEMLEVYTELLPLRDELSMTLFIEMSDQEQLRAFNKTLVGIENHVNLIFSGHAVSSYEPDSEDETDGNHSYTQSVHYLRFAFNPEQKEAFLNAASGVRLCVDHPNYQCETALSDELIADLQKQLQG